MGGRPEGGLPTGEGDPTLALIVTLFLFFVILIFDSIDGIGFHVSDAFARLLETLTLTICGAYFAGRTLEKSIRR